MKNKKYSVCDLIKIRKKIREKYEKEANISVGHIKKIRNHYSSKIKSYPEYKESFDYVDKIFPMSKVKDVSILFCDRKFLDSLGYSSAKGFFNRLEKVIVMPHTDKIDSNNAWKNITCLSTQDETIVHELLHFVSSTISRLFTSEMAEEEFAYGYSIGYLRSKKYSDDYIINHILMPYLINEVIDIEKIAKLSLVSKGYNLKDFCALSDKKQNIILNKIVDEDDVYSIIRSEAVKKGQELIDIYTRKTIYSHDNYDHGDDKTKYDLLDI